MLTLILKTVIDFTSENFKKPERVSSSINSSCTSNGQFLPMSHLYKKDSFLIRGLKEQLEGSSSVGTTCLYSKIDLSNDAEDIFVQLKNVRDKLAQRLDENLEEPILFLIFEDISKVIFDSKYLCDVFVWLVFYGPRVNVWVVANQRATQSIHIKHWLEKLGFHTSPIVLKKDLVPDPVVLYLS